MKKIFLSITIIAIFLFLIYAVALNFLSELYLSKAKAAEAASFFEKAENNYNLAIKLNQNNSEAWASYANLLHHASLAYKNRFKKAEFLYSRAIKLNPRNAQYYLMLGQVQLEMKKDGLEIVKKAMANFRSAFINDPNGFNIAYSVGYTGISIWDHLDKSDKELILDRLRFSIELRPEYFEFIYPRFWKITKDFRILQQLRPLESEYRKKEKLLRIAKFKQDYKIKGPEAGNLITKQSWIGKDKKGASSYENGNMYWNGTIEAPINLPKGEVILKIQAQGNPANGIYPYMIIELDAEEIGETFLDSNQWKEYLFKINTDGGIKILSITFPNDYYGENADRNLYIGEVKVIKDER